jgi:phasin
MNDASVRADGNTRMVPSPKASFVIPGFEMSIPAAIPDFVEKGGAQAKENYEKLKTATDEVAGVVEASYSTAAKGATDYGLKVIEITHANTNAGFDLLDKLVAAKSPSEAIELSAAHARRQFDAVSTQSKELWALTQQVATDVVEPLKTGMSKALQRNV